MKNLNKFGPTLLTLSGLGITTALILTGKKPGEISDDQAEKRFQLLVAGVAVGVAGTIWAFATRSK